MKKTLLLLLLPILGFSQNQYSYGFTGTTADLTTAGWVTTNQSTSPSATLWTVASYTPVTVSATVTPTPFQTQDYTTGQTCPIPNGQDGTPNTFALVNYTSTSSSASSGATISNWLISPVVNVQNGDVVTFYSRIGKYSATNTASFADNLQLRMSTTGAASTNPSTGPTDMGSFTNLLVEINPSFNLTSYPATWTQYSYTVSGLTGPTDVKFGFRYYVINGGPNGSNSDIIGIDTFSVDRTVASTQSFFTNNFSIYPNPANNVLNLSVKNGLTVNEISVVDINGRTVKTINNSFDSEMEINVSDLTSGVYMLNVKTEEGVATSKFVKN